MNIERRYGTSPAQRGSAGGGNCPDVLRLDNGDYLIIGKTPGVPNISARDLTKHGASIGPDEQAVVVPADVMHAAAHDITRHTPPANQPKEQPCTAESPPQKSPAPSPPEATPTP